MELWYTEEQIAGLRLSFKIKETLANQQTSHQHLAILDTEAFGPMLVLDGLVMTTAADEYIYHEMISHPALFTHPCPRKVVVVGGGDGGAIREVLKHPEVEEVILAEIDGEVVAKAREYLPGIAGVFNDPRVAIEIGDGLAFLEGQRGELDVVLVDSTEPIGASKGLFSQAFYAAVFNALKPDGLMVAQTESPFYNQDILLQAHRDIKATFPRVYTYLANIPTYPSGLWSFTLASKQHDPFVHQRQPQAEFISKYYTPELHRSCFTLPRFVQDLLDGA